MHPSQMETSADDLKASIYYRLLDDTDYKMQVIDRSLLFRLTIQSTKHLDSDMDLYYLTLLNENLQG